MILRQARQQITHTKDRLRLHALDALLRFELLGLHLGLRRTETSFQLGNFTQQASFRLMVRYGISAPTVS